MVGGWFLARGSVGRKAPLHASLLGTGVCQSLVSSGAFSELLMVDCKCPRDSDVANLHSLLSPVSPITSTTIISTPRERDGHVSPHCHGLPFLGFDFFEPRTMKSTYVYWEPRSW